MGMADWRASQVGPAHRSWSVKRSSRRAGGKYRNVPGRPADVEGVQHGSTATCPDLDGLECTLRDGDLRRWTAVDALPADGMQEVRSSSPRSSTGQKYDSKKLAQGSW